MRHSSVTRNQYYIRQKERLETEAQKLLEKEKNRNITMLRSRQASLDCVIGNLGLAHAAASTKGDSVLEEQKLLSSRKDVARKRFNSAYSELLEKRAQSLCKEESRRRFLEVARSIEKKRAAAIAALPPPPSDPLDPHFTGAAPCRLCPRIIHQHRQMMVDAGTPIMESAEEQLSPAHRISVRSEESTFGCDAFETAAVETLCSDFAQRQAIRFATETSLKSQKRCIQALKRWRFRSAFRI
uniref:Uncharacterized protein n=1 Tax=Mesocestoides corti TaxID=53468 RepID=A0A5K3FK60_MESCO